MFLIKLFFLLYFKKTDYVRSILVYFNRYYSYFCMNFFLRSPFSVFKIRSYVRVPKNYHFNQKRDTILKVTKFRRGIGSVLFTDEVGVRIQKRGTRVSKTRDCIQ